MASGEIRAALESMEFARNLPTAHVEKLASLASQVEFTEDEVIFREGDLGDTLYAIEEGLVAVDTHVPGRGRTRILTVGPGQMLGWSALFEQMHKTATARVILPTRALVLDAHEVRNLCQSDHELGCALGWQIAELIAGRLKATRMQLLDMFAPAQ